MLNTIIWFIVAIIGAILGAGVVLLVLFTVLEIRKRLTGRHWTGDNYSLIRIAMAVGAIIGIYLTSELAQLLGWVNG